MNKATWVSRELISNPLYLGLCTTPAAFERELRKLKLPRNQWPDFLATPRANATVHYLSHPVTGSVAIVCMPKRKGTSREQYYAMLVHEAVHVWQWIKEEIGEKAPSSEFEAYSVQQMSQALMIAWRDAG